MHGTVCPVYLVEFSMKILLDFVYTARQYQTWASENSVIWTECLLKITFSDGSSERACLSYAAVKFYLGNISCNHKSAVCAAIDVRLIISSIFFFGLISPVCIQGQLRESADGDGQERWQRLGRQGTLTDFVSLWRGHELAPDCVGFGRIIIIGFIMVS